MDPKIDMNSSQSSLVPNEKQVYLTWQNVDFSVPLKKSDIKTMTMQEEQAQGDRDSLKPQNLKLLSESELRLHMIKKKAQ